MHVDDGRYELPAEHAEVLLDEESLLYTAPLARFATSIPLPEVIEAYRTGGWASIAIARAYPHAEVHGFDIDEASIELARANADGVPVTFEVQDITSTRPSASTG